MVIRVVLCECEMEEVWFRPCDSHKICTTCNKMVKPPPFRLFLDAESSCADGGKFRVLSDAIAEGQLILKNDRTYHSFTVFFEGCPILEAHNGQG